MSPLTIQSQTCGDVIVHSTVRQRVEEDDQREDREQERRPKQDDPVSELRLPKTRDQVLSGRSLVAVTPPPNSGDKLLRPRAPTSPRDPALVTLHNMRIFQGHLRITGPCPHHPNPRA